MGDPGLELFQRGVGPAFPGRFQILGQQSPLQGEHLGEPSVQIAFPGDRKEHPHLAFADFLPALIGSGALS